MVVCDQTPCNTPRVVVQVLRDNVCEIESIVHRILTVFVVAGRGHVTSTPPTSLIVSIGRAKLFWQTRVGLKLRSFSFCYPASHHFLVDGLCHPHWYLLGMIVG